MNFKCNILTIIFIVVITVVVLVAPPLLSLEADQPVDRECDPEGEDDTEGSEGDERTNTVGDAPGQVVQSRGSCQLQNLHRLQGTGLEQQTVRETSGDWHETTDCQGNFRGLA